MFEMFNIDIVEMNFEQVLVELEWIVQQFESGEVELECFIVIYECGVVLWVYCEGKLKDVEFKVDKIVKGEDGSLLFELVQLDQ